MLSERMLPWSTRHHVRERPFLHAWIGRRPALQHHALEPRGRCGAGPLTGVSGIWLASADVAKLSPPQRAALSDWLARGGTMFLVGNAASDFHAGPSTRTPGQILAHIGDLLDWALSIAQGKQQWQDSEPLPWNQQIDRFFAALKVFETYLASTEELHAAAEKLGFCHRTRAARSDGHTPECLAIDVLRRRGARP